MEIKPNQGPTWVQRGLFTTARTACRIQRDPLLPSSLDAARPPALLRPPRPCAGGRVVSRGDAVPREIQAILPAGEPRAGRKLVKNRPEENAPGCRACHRDARCIRAVVARKTAFGHICTRATFRQSRNLCDIRRQVQPVSNCSRLTTFQKLRRWVCQRAVKSVF